MRIKSLEHSKEMARSISAHTVPKSLTTLLRKYYNFSEIIDLLNYEDDLYGLKHKLLSLKKDPFEPNDRIIFFNREPSLYLRQRENLLCFNLQKILSDLDISNGFCIVLTQHESQDYFNEIYKDTSTDEFPISVFDYWHFSDLMPYPTDQIDLNFDHIEKNYITLNRIHKKHRSLVVGYLEHYNILDKGMVSYNAIRTAFTKPVYKQVSDTEVFIDPGRAYQYIVSEPLTTANEDWVIRDKHTQQILESINSRGVRWAYKNFEEITNVENYAHAVSSCSDLLQRAFLWIATESDANYPVSLLSEKSARPFYAKRPFVIVSGPGSLKRIQSFGFKTFGDYWDESYDSETDICTRIKKVMSIVNDIAQLNHLEIISLADSMKDVLEYNYQHLLNFDQYQLNSIEQQIRCNL